MSDRDDFEEFLRRRREERYPDRDRRRPDDDRSAPDPDAPDRTDAPDGTAGTVSEPGAQDRTPRRRTRAGRPDPVSRSQSRSRREELAGNLTRWRGNIPSPSDFARRRAKSDTAGEDSSNAAPAGGSATGDAKAPTQTQKWIHLAIGAVLVWLGVPPQVSKRLAPLVTKILGIIIPFSMLLPLVLFAGLSGGLSDPVAKTDAYQQAPTPVVRALEKIAGENQIPERVLLGLALTQTRYGQQSPYDGIDRTKTQKGSIRSVFPTVRPDIGSANKKQGLGMFLVTPTFAQDKGFNPQDVNASAKALAKQMGEKYAKALARNPKIRTDPQASDELWLSIIGELPIVDPAASMFRCPLPEGTANLGDSVSTVMQCVLGRAPSLAVVRVVTPGTAGGGYLLRYRYGIDAVTQLTQEALAVAYAQSVRLGANPPPTGSPPGARPGWPTLEQMKARCAGLPTAIFPMNAAAWKSYSSANAGASPCDPLANITAMANWLVSKAVQLPAAFVPNPEQPYDAETLIWKDVPLAVGSTANLDKFRKQGPAGGYVAPAECLTQVEATVKSLMDSAQWGPLRQYAAFDDTNDADHAKRNALYLDALAALNLVPVNRGYLCLNESKLPRQFDWYNVLYAAARSLAAEYGDTAAQSAPPPGVAALIGAQQVAGRAYQERAVPEPALGTDPVVLRHSATELQWSVPPVLRSRPPASVSSLAQRVLDNILWLGGIVRGDPRAGQQPRGLLSTLGAIGIAVERQRGNPVILTQDSRLVHPDGCNGSGSALMLKDMALRWNALCAAAQADGIDLSINSDWRSLADQQAVFARYGAERAAPPCTSADVPTGCPHQRGAALDVSTGTGETPAANDQPQYKWLHTIVGCIDIPAKNYRQLSTVYTPQEYLAAASPPCGALQPVKRFQLYGLVALCRTPDEPWSDPSVILCAQYGPVYQKYLGGDGGVIRERWHLDLGEILIPGGGVAGNVDCAGQVTVNPDDRQSVAYAVKRIFYCKTAAAGLTALAPLGDSAVYPANANYRNLAEQIAAEAVMIAYCESGFTSVRNSYGYTGIFQMGGHEFETFSGGLPAEMNFDPVANISAAAGYWLNGFINYNGGGHWGGWHPWAVVNTDYDGPNDAVQLPIISRFSSTDYPGQYSNGGIPNWAKAPEQFWPPSPGCGAVWSVDSKKAWADAPAKTLEGLTLPGGATPGTGAVGIVGDSLTVGTQTKLPAAAGLKGRTVQIWAKVGQSINQDVTAQVKAYAANSSVVVVALGTNDSAGGISAAEATRRINSVLAVAGGARVLWVNVWRDEQDAAARDGAVAFNAALRSVAAKNSKLVVLDWFSYVEANLDTYRSEYMAGDRIHLDPGGYTWRANWIGAQVAASGA